ncbi:MAG: oxygen-independent coproporphyrinogen III oxidase [Bacteroidota bacterium]
MSQQLIRKYNIPGPRYTSYPTVPYWEEAYFSTDKWKASVLRTFEESPEISLYIHLPFCEKLCTFCGCNKRITRNHQVEGPYIDSLLEEWRMYKELLPSPPTISEIHLGGGTPTFFHPDELERLIVGLKEGAKVASNASLSFEGNPVNTRPTHLSRLYDLGFRRVSFGIQDFDPIVQDLINRVQTFEQVTEVTREARQIGYTSVNFDIIYGLPRQTEDSILDTIDKVRLLRPDRIAYYSYAHVPWIKGVGQRKFTEADLPRNGAKRRLYELGRNLLEEIGYTEIGMDHFALPTDELYTALFDKELHRNFMGYTPSTSRLMVGLGVSSISDSWYGFAQNEKKVETYQARVAAGELPVFRGHMLTQEDLVLRQHILNLMCKLETSWVPDQLQTPVLAEVLPRLEELQRDGLIELTDTDLWVPPEGLPFIRNICMAFDARMWRKKPQTQLFSMTI